MIIPSASRIDEIAEYYVPVKNREIAAVSAARVANGLDPVISLGIGAPDGFPPARVVETLCLDAKNKDAHRYQDFRGIPEVRKAMSAWYDRWYGVDLDFETQILPLSGAKEGIFLTSLAFLNKGDKVLVPNPGYPTYISASKLVEAEVVSYDLLPENEYYPDFNVLEKMDLERVKMMWLNYPNMPTGAPGTLEIFRRAVEFGRKHSILVCSDNPYSFVRNDNPLSIFMIDGSSDCCLELNSLSKSHNMSGWRIGMACASSEIIERLFRVQSQVDSGMFRPIQYAAIEALNQNEDWYRQLNEEYYNRERVGKLVMEAIGAEYRQNSQGLFLWGKISPDNPFLSSTDSSKTLGERISDRLLYDYGVYVTPGTIFGTNGNDYIRICLCVDVTTLTKVLAILQK